MWRKYSLSTGTSFRAQAFPSGIFPSSDLWGEKQRWWRGKNECQAGGVHEGVSSSCGLEGKQATLTFNGFEWQAVSAASAHEEWLEKGPFSIVLSMTFPAMLQWGQVLQGVKIGRPTDGLGCCPCSSDIWQKHHSHLRTKGRPEARAGHAEWDYAEIGKGPMKPPDPSEHVLERCGLPIPCFVCLR